MIAPSLDLAYAIAAYSLAGAGAILLLWSLFWDRSRGRPRCPKCWYDMAGLLTPGAPVPAPCPECGHAPKSLKSLHHTRRRWSRAWPSLLIFAGAWLLYHLPIVHAYGWSELAPTWLLAAIAPDPMALIQHKDMKADHPAGPVAVALRRRIANDPANTLVNRLIAFRLANQIRHTDARRIQAPVSGPLTPVCNVYSLADLARPCSVTRKVYHVGNATQAVRLSGLEDTDGAVAYFAEFLQANKVDNAPSQPWAELIGTTLVVSAPELVQKEVQRLLAAVRAEPGTSPDGTMTVHSLAPLEAPLLEGVSEAIRADAWESLKRDVVRHLGRFIDTEGWLFNGGNRAAGCLICDRFVVMTPKPDPQLQTLVRDHLAAFASNAARTQADENTVVLNLHAVEQRCRLRPGILDYPIDQSISAAATRLLEPGAWLTNGGDRADIAPFHGRLIVRTQPRDVDLLRRVEHLVTCLETERSRIDLAPDVAIFDMSAVIESRWHALQNQNLAPDERERREFSLVEDLRTEIGRNKIDPDGSTAWTWNWIGSRVVVQGSPQALKWFEEYTHSPR